MLFNSITLLSAAMALVDSVHADDTCYEDTSADTQQVFSNSNCPSSIPLSCENTTVVKDMCCYEYPGGVMLQTQFWDYNPSNGPNDSFTVHGLWPDNCAMDGSYQQNCNSKLNVGSVTNVLKSFGEDELLSNMTKYWKNINGNDASLWQHEFNKHGTCVNTINPSCYGDDFKTNQNVVDYFKVAFHLFEQLPTFEWLKDAGITPSNSKTYTSDEISKALKDKFGHEVYIGCDKNNGLNEVWYFHQLKGSLLGEQFHRIDSFSSSKCPSSGIKFVPKTSSTSPSSSSTFSGSSPTSTGDVSKGYVKLTGQSGCLIKSGQWYVSGTCATYRLEEAEFGGYNLRSSAGYCALNSDGFLACSQGTSPDQFSFDEDTKILSINGGDQWYADKVPSGYEKVSIAPGSGNVEFKLKFD